MTIVSVIRIVILRTHTHGHARGCRTPKTTHRAPRGNKHTQTRRTPRGTEEPEPELPSSQNQIITHAKLHQPTRLHQHQQLYAAFNYPSHLDNSVKQHRNPLPKLKPKPKNQSSHNHNCPLKKHPPTSPSHPSSPSSHSHPVYSALFFKPQCLHPYLPVAPKLPRAPTMRPTRQANGSSPSLPLSHPLTMPVE